MGKPFRRRLSSVRGQGMAPALRADYAPDVDPGRDDA
jgi:hypothetical protein